jgi:hypothetical protein
MKKLTVEIKDVDVKLIRFFNTDPYQGFEDIPERTVTDVDSEVAEITALQALKPIGLFKQNGGSYILITKKPNT